MLSSKLVRIVVICIFLGVGVWLVAAPADLGTETVAHQQALQALAPVPVNGDRVVSGDSGAAVSPVVVNMKDVPPGVYDPDNQYDRWQKGEIDMDENDGILSDVELAAMREAALNLPPSDAVQEAVSGPSPLAPSQGAAFDSIDYNECCGGGGNVPPDPELAVGPNHVIAVVNVAFEIYDQNGNTLQAPTTFASFMGGNSNCTGVFDPNAVYDESADRYVLGIDADGSYYCLAVSQTGDPLGSWNIYSFPMGSDFFDYPHAGVGRDAIYMGANIFRCRGPFSCSFLTSRIYAFDKAAMYTGAAASFVERSLNSSEDTPQPLNLHGWNQGTWPNSGPHYFLTETNYDGAHYTVFAWSDPFGANTLSTVGTMDLVAATGVSAGLPVDVPQSGSSATLQANDFRPQDFEYRNGYGWSVQTIACNPGGGTVDCIRWAQIDLSNANVVDAGVYASNGSYRFFGDLAVNHCNDMAVGYTKSSSSIFPGIWYTGRESTDPAGTLQAEAQLKAGELTYTAFDGSPHRWGDYTEMTIAPDGETFWYLGEYSKNTGNADGRWGTYIGSFTFGNCSAGGDPTPTAEPPTPTATSEGPTPTPVTPTATPVPPTPTPVPPTPTPGSSSTMHVGDLDSVSVNNGSTWTANVTILVVDNNGTPVSNATVSGNWSNGATGSASCVTNGSGVCTVSTSGIRKNISSVTFTVSNVTHSTLTYNSGANTDPDGDSNGTVIVVSKP